jgi:PH domain
MAYTKGANSKVTRADIDAQAVKSDFMLMCMRPGLKPGQKKPEKKKEKWRRIYGVICGAALFTFKAKDSRRFEFAIELKQHAVEAVPEGMGADPDRFEFELVPRNTSEPSWAFAVDEFDQRTDWVEALGNAKTGQGTNKEIIEMEERLRRNQYDIPPEGAFVVFASSPPSSHRGADIKLPSFLPFFV